ncbi:MAG: M3 family oligoendopeptidase [Planctomycetota bacterium]|nr:M3 family oligoendopeptidase [Planctomycetota bacterium]
MSPATEVKTADALPRWDLSNIFQGIDGNHYINAVAAMEEELRHLETFYDQHHIHRLAEGTKVDAEKTSHTLIHLLNHLNRLLLASETLQAYVYALITTDSFDAAAAREHSKLEILGTRRQQLDVRLKGWVGSWREQLPAVIGSHVVLQKHKFFLELIADQSRYLMTEAMEQLAAELALDAGQAFGRLQGNVTSQLKVEIDKDGKNEELPITMIRNLAYDPDPAIRKKAYQAEQKGWASIRTTVAACLNGVKGTAITLAKHRGRPSVLAEALVDNRIDQPTLDALLGAIRESVPVFRRYLSAKAKKLGHKQLPWWDLFAPLGAATSRYTWQAARDFIVDKFSTFSQDMGQFAAHSFDHKWIDAEPRVGKRGGAYCMPVPGVEESRILCNFDGSFEQLSTLAHELGHGYHNHCQQGLEMLRRGSPSTLAETASIFCETLVAEAALPLSEPAEQLMILEAQLAGATQVCLDISSRFLFETAIVERRGSSELSAEEFCELMLDAQRQTYGDGVDPATYHPYMWLLKPHYYSHTENFYNFPYAFGHLFGLGLYAIYREEGESFVPRYQQLLRDTGQDQAAPLAKRFGLDITDQAFWRRSLQVIEQQVERYESLKV